MPRKPTSKELLQKVSVLQEENQRLKEKVTRFEKLIENAGIPMGVYDPDGVLLTSFDITERKRVEEALRKNEARLRAIFENTSVSIALTDLGGRWVEANPAFRKMLGYEPGEVTQLDHAGLVYPEDMEESCRRLQGILRKDHDRDRFEVRYFRKDGSIVWVDLCVSPLHSPEGTIESVIGIGTDITERKQAEEALRESEELYRKLFEGALDGIALADADTGIILDCNDALLKLVERERDEVVGKSQKILHPPEGAFGDVSRTFEEHRATRQGQVIAAKLITKTGKMRDVEIKANFNEIGNRKVLQGVFRDITERRRAEEALKESEEKYRILFEMESDALLLVDDETLQILDANAAAVTLFQYGREELLARKTLDLSAEPENTLRAIRQKVTRILLRWRLKKDGTRFPAEITRSIFKWKGREVYIAAFRDISARMEAEKELREIRDLLMSILDNAPALIYVNTLDNRYRLVNKAWERFVGKTQEQVAGQSFEEVFSARIALEFSTINQEVMVTRSPVLGEESILRHGERFHFHTTKFPMIGAGGEMEAVGGISIDITERKRVEEELRRSESRFRTYFDMPLHGIAITSPETGWIQINDRLCSILGYPRDELIHMRWSEMTHPDDLAADAEQFNRLLSGQIEQYSMDKRFIRKDGTVVWASISVGCVRKSDGRVDYVIGLMENITERKRAEEALRESEEKYRLVSENVPLVIYSAFPDEPSTDIFISSRIEGLTGYGTKDYLETQGLWDKTVHPEDRDRVWREINKHRRDKIDLDVEYRMVAKDGAVKWVRDKARPVLTEGGEILRIDGFVEDISEQKKVEEELRQSRAQLFQAQKMESLGILVAGLTHEINNPVNTIVMNAPLLRRVWEDLLPILQEYAERDPCRRYGGLTSDFLAENTGQLISDMDRAGNRISKIIQGLKDFARKTGSTEVGLVSMNVSAANALNLAGSTARKSGITLSLEAGKDLPTIKGDPVHVEQIILNLLINGMQAITHDHGKISVITGFQKERRRIFVSVEDNGSGIDPGAHHKVFDPFFTTRQAEGGTGLGLAITYSLVKANKGEITFFSKKGKGTTFTVTFPTAPEIRPIRILVADDEESLRDIIVYALEREQGYSVEQASTGAEALLKIGTFTPDLVILDVFMPDTDGLEVCRALKKDPRLSGIKVIIITAHADDPKLDQIKRLGFKEILEKPLRLDELLNQARKMLGEGERGLKG